METRSLRPYANIVALMLLTSLALAFTVDVNVTDQAGIRLVLPEHVGAWTGMEIRFCQNGTCQREFDADQLADRNVCPVCGGILDSMTLGEKQLLPPDTELIKKRYSRPDGGDIYASIVLSGKERASIHRPQICLVSQGHEIEKSTVLDVPLAGRRDLSVMVLDMLHASRGADGLTRQSANYYAYWFVGKGRETPYHTQRMVWMATDRILHNVSHRWAYIAIAGGRNPSSDAYQDQIRDFVSGLYPQIALN